MPTAVEMARWSVFFLLFVVLVIVSATDIRERRIPNWTVLAIAVLFVPWVFVGPHVSILASLAAALVAFAISFALYAFRVLGAGDSKLLAAVSLFVGLDQLLPFLLLVALAGGALAIMSLARNPVQALVMFQMHGKGSLGRGVPYGVAIAIAVVLVITWPFAQRAFG